MPSIYVSKTGSDTSGVGNGTESQPYLTIYKAMTIGVSGDTINIGPGLFDNSGATTLLNTNNKSFNIVGTKANNDIADTTNNTVIKTMTTAHGLNITVNNASLTNLMIDASGASTLNILNIVGTASIDRTNISFTNVLFNGGGSIKTVNMSYVRNITFTNCVFPKTTGASYGIIVNSGKNVIVTGSTIKMNALGSIQVTDLSSTAIDISTDNVFINEFSDANTGDVSSSGLIRIDTNGVTYGTANGVAVKIPSAFVNEYKQVSGAVTTGFTLGGITLLSNNTNMFKHTTLSTYCNSTGYVKIKASGSNVWNVNSPFNILQAVKVALSGDLIQLSVGKYTQTTGIGVLSLRSNQGASAVVGPVDKAITIKGIRANGDINDYANNSILETSSTGDYGIDIEMSNVTIQDFIHKNTAASTYFQLYIGKGQVGTNRPVISNITVKNVKIHVMNHTTTRALTTNSVNGLVIDEFETNAVTNGSMSISSTRNCVVKNCILPISGWKKTISISVSGSSSDKGCSNIDLTQNNTFYNTSSVLASESATGDISGADAGVISIEPDITTPTPITYGYDNTNNVMLPSNFTIRYLAGGNYAAFTNNSNITRHSGFITAFAAAYVKTNATNTDEIYVERGFKIQNGVNIASNSNVINVEAGLYSENLIVNKAVNVICTRGATDASSDSTIIQPAIINGEYPRIQNNNVVFKNAILEARSDLSNIYVFMVNGVTSGSQFIDICNVKLENIKFKGINKGMAINSVDTIEISGCQFTETINSSLYLSSVKNLTMHDCSIARSSSSSISIGVTREKNPDVTVRNVNLVNNNVFYSSGNSSNAAIITITPVSGYITGTTNTNSTSILYGYDISKNIILPSEISYALDVSGMPSVILSNIRTFIDDFGYQSSLIGLGITNYAIKNLQSNVLYEYVNNAFYQTSNPPSTVQYVPEGYTQPIDIVVSTTNENVVSIVTTINNDTHAVIGSAGYAVNLPFRGALTSFEVNAFDSTNAKITDFSNAPITISMSIPNANTSSLLELLKLDPDTFLPYEPQPIGYPRPMTYNSVSGLWSATLPSLSTFGVKVKGANIPCFTSGTMIATPNGQVLVENINTGDLVLTADKRAVPVTVYTSEIKSATTQNAPYYIPAKTFGKNQPNAITLSPRHAIQMRPGVWEIPQFATARYSQIKQVSVGKKVNYFHLELPNYFTDNLIANGNIVESYGGNAKLAPGVPLYKFNNKLGGFTRPMDHISSKVSSSK
jgi:hypothetical protein